MKRPTDIRPTTTASPEGRPARPNVSPHRLVLRIFLLIALVVGAAAAGGLVFGIPGGLIAALLVGSAAVIFNPEMWATRQRIDDLKSSDGTEAA